MSNVVSFANFKKPAPANKSRHPRQPRKMRSAGVAIKLATPVWMVMKGNHTLFVKEQPQDVS